MSKKLERVLGLCLGTGAPVISTMSWLLCCCSAVLGPPFLLPAVVPTGSARGSVTTPRVGYWQGLSENPLGREQSAGVPGVCLTPESTRGQGWFWMPS